MTELYKEKEVRAGIAFLDKKDPEWREDLDVDYLDMWDCENCILGQRHGDYLDGLAELGLTDEDSYRLGLDLKMEDLKGEDPDGHPVSMGRKRYDDLRETWITLGGLEKVAA